MTMGHDIQVSRECVIEGLACTGARSSRLSRQGLARTANEDRRRAAAADTEGDPDMRA